MKAPASESGPGHDRWLDLGQWARHGSHGRQAPRERFRTRHEGGWRHSGHHNSMEVALKHPPSAAQQRFVIDDPSKVGEARRAAQTLASFGFTAEIAGKVAIA